MVGIRNIKKLRKYYLFEAYTAFLNAHDTVLFVNANSQQMRKLIKPLGLPINVMACKNTLLKKKYAKYPFFNNVLAGELCLIGIKYSEINLSECKKFYELLLKSGTLVLGGLYLQMNNKRVFYLPVDASILEYHNNAIRIFNRILGATVVPVVYGNTKKLYQAFFYPYYFFFMNLRGIFAGCSAISQWSQENNRQV